MVYIYYQFGPMWVYWVLWELVTYTLYIFHFILAYPKISAGFIVGLVILSIFWHFYVMCKNRRRRQWKYTTLHNINDKLERIPNDIVDQLGINDKLERMQNDILDQLDDKLERIRNDIMDQLDDKLERIPNDIMDQLYDKLERMPNDIMDQLDDKLESDIMDHLRRLDDKLDRIQMRNDIIAQHVEENGGKAE